MTTKSLQSFEAILADGKADSIQKQILSYLKLGHLTTDNLVKITGKKYSTVSARVSNLNELGYAKYLTMPTGSQSLICYVSDENERAEIRRQVAESKKRQFIKAGLKNGYLVEENGKLYVADGHKPVKTLETLGYSFESGV